MFTRLDRYILRQLLGALAAVTTALVALIWLTQSLHFVELVVNRGLSLRVFLQLTGLMVPGFLTVILPITTFVVVQFTYQRLTGDRELTVMRAAGLSPWALSRPGLMLASISTALCLILNIWIVPASSEAFRRYQFEIRNRVAAFLLQEGVFTAISDQLTVYVRARDPDGTLRGIMVEDDRDPHTHATILAQSGHLSTTGNTPRVLLDNGSREDIDPKTGRLDVLTFAQDTVDLATSNHGEDARLHDVNEMSMHELLNPDASIPERDWGKLAVEAHHRLTQPLTALSFTLVALAAVLTGSFHRHGNVLRPAAAVGLLVALLATGLVASSLATRHIALIPMIWAQAVVPGMAAAWMLFVPGAAERVMARTGRRPRPTGTTRGKAGPNTTGANLTGAGAPAPEPGA
jgi:lipopolysaccharide export system permease protein